MTAQAWLYWSGTALTGLAMAYSLAAWLASRARRSRWQSMPATLLPVTILPPVTILKPLCGAEHELYECLRSFCDQTYPRFQIVFGVSDGRRSRDRRRCDRLQREFPAIDLSSRWIAAQHGSSRKVSNLINMMSLASHDYLVMSDSDVRVGRDYLSEVVPRCSIRGRHRDLPLSRLSAARACGRCSALSSSTTGSSRRCASRPCPARVQFAFGATIAHAPPGARAHRRIHVDSESAGGRLPAGGADAPDGLAHRAVGRGGRDLRRRARLRRAGASRAALAAHDSRGPSDRIRALLHHLRRAGGRLGSLLAAGAWPRSPCSGVTAAARVLLHLHVRAASAGACAAAGRCRSPGRAQLRSLVLGIRHAPRAMAGRPHRT